MGVCDPRNFLQPCLLLLLRERSDHGYDLVNRLRELHLGEGDAGAVYRALRGLERDGFVRSAWQTSGAGPARRIYQVTPSGVADLDRQALLLEATHQTLHVFRGRYAAEFAHRNGHMQLANGNGNGNGHAHPPARQENTGRAEIDQRDRVAHGLPDDRGVYPPLSAGS